MSRIDQPNIYVIAGVNGGGKSSIGGASIRHPGEDYYNPDEVARRLMNIQPGLSLQDANSAAWRQGVVLLKRAIEERLEFVFETTLGGDTITLLLKDAAARGCAVHVWYVGLSSPELHIARVRSRVAKGGHDIPEADIWRRYQHSRSNLIHLLPHLRSLRLFDNSADANPADGRRPPLRLLLDVKGGRIVGPADLSETPSWAKPIVAAALKLVPSKRS
ncbi:MAG TPA: zeta toxin family protein [Nitrospira sp.]|nr:zeta toxin family protein [Nitrospira sp.]